MKLFAIIFGAIVAIFALGYMIIRIVKTPKGWHFTDKAVVRNVIANSTGLVAGLVLVALGIFVL